MTHEPFDHSTQGAREQDYASSGVFKKKTDAGDLHMFFSSNIVPAGLTDEEIGICLKLHPERKKISERLILKKKDQIRAGLQGRLESDYFALEHERETLSLAFGAHAASVSAEEIATLYSEIRVTTYSPIPLPQELIRSPMTRENFALGVKMLTESMERTAASC